MSKTEHGPLKAFQKDGLKEERILNKKFQWFLSLFVCSIKLAKFHEKRTPFCP